MPRQDSPSPARRPQMDQRASSSHTVSKGSPTAGHLSKSHKGSSTKLHKAHAVGHGRHPHARVPSYGKGLHKLSKLGPGEPGDSTGHPRHNTSSAAQSPTGSPTTQVFPRNSSQTSLPRSGSKFSLKKNASTVSIAKLGNQPKSEKAKTKNNLRKKHTGDAPSTGTANFTLEDDGQDDNWEEASSSQSPNTSRHTSIGRKTPQIEDPPSPDEPPGRSPSNLPHSPPQSPPANSSAYIDQAKADSQQKNSKYSHPLDGDEVSQRLLDRSRHNADPKVSNISATITPDGSSGSPAFNNHDPSSMKEPSMPPDGISRFLSGTGSNSGSATPGSISHLQSHLTHISQKGHSSPQRPESPTASSSTAKPDARRAQSATNLTHPRLTNGESGSVSPPKSEQSSPRKSVKPKSTPRVSPYESARGADPNAGKSLTQLKLDLQRMSTLHDIPTSTHPMMYQHGSVPGIQNPNASSGEMAARLARQYQQAGKEYRNARRFHPDLIVMHGLSKKAARKKKGDGQKGKGAKTPATSVSGGSSIERSGGRGRVRFELGRSPGDAEDVNGEGGAQGEVGGVEGLLRRMWDQGMDGGISED